MRKLLYAFVFASILLLAGFTSFASENEPNDGGTLPEYAVWLPVVVGQTVPEYCLMGTFVAARGGFVGWWGGEFYGDSRLPDAWAGIIATEPDFREESILYSGTWYNVKLGPGYAIAAVPLSPLGDIQVGSRYYSRIKYECEREGIVYHVLMVGSAIAGP